MHLPLTNRSTWSPASLSNTTREPLANSEATVQKAAPEPKVITTKPVHMEEMDPLDKLGKEQAQNLELIMEVPLQVMPGA